MKQLLYIILLTAALAACKKDKTTGNNCNRIAAVNGHKLEYDSEGRLVKYFDSFQASDYSVSYENSNKTVTVVKVTNGASAKYLLDDQGLTILLEGRTSAGVLIGKRTCLRNSKGYVTDATYESYNTATGVLLSRTTYRYAYTFDGNGNVIKMIQTQPANPSYMHTTEFVYDVTQKYTKFILNAESLLFKTLMGLPIDNPSPVNRLIKVKQNGVETIGFIYGTDATGRVIFNKQTPLIAAEAAWEVTIGYECN